MRAIRNHGTALVPLLSTLVVVLLSPLAADLALADGSSAPHARSAIVHSLAPHVGGSPLAVGSGVRSSRSSGLTFGGLTSKGWPLVIKVSRNGRRVTRAVAAIELSCTSGMDLTVPDEYTGLRISRSRRFSESFTMPAQEVEGGSLAGSGAITGKLNRRRTAVSGTWRLHLVFSEPSQPADTCDSGTLKYSARR